MIKDLIDMIPIAKHLGIKMSESSANCVIGTMDVTLEISGGSGNIHGGALMAFADTLGSVGSYHCLPEGSKQTTTLESKTNFFRPAKVGTTVTGCSVPLHIGRRTTVWQTTITNEDGKTVAIVSQTQMVI